MAWASQRVLGVVPARGGSKGIPRKNLAVVAGQSLLGRVGSVAGALPWLDAAVLSTDDVEIAQEGRRCGLEVPFMRPPALAFDEASSIDVWRHAWLECEKLHGRRYDLSVLLEPTSPMRRRQDVERTVAALVERGSDGAATVSRAPAHFTPEKCLTVDDGGVIHFYLPEGERHFRRQTISPYYFRNGICYAVTRKALVEERNIIQRNCVAVIIDRPVANIDEPLDLEWAGFLLDRERRAARG